MANTISGQRGYVPFRAWLYQHRNDDATINEIAGLFMLDPCEPPLWQMRSFHEYEVHLIYHHRASADTQARLEVVWQRYQAYKRAKMEAAS